MKKVGDITVNDGKGLMDNEGLCDSLLLDLNNVPKLLMTGQYIQFCALISSMGQKLVNLKKGIKADRQAMEEKYNDLKQLNDRLVRQIPVEKDGASDGKN